MIHFGKHKYWLKEKANFKALMFTSKLTKCNQLTSSLANKLFTNAYFSIYLTQLDNQSTYKIFLNFIGFKEAILY